MPKIEKSSRKQRLCIVELRQRIGMNADEFEQLKRRRDLNDAHKRDASLLIKILIRIRNEAPKGLWRLHKTYGDTGERTHHV